MICFNQPRPLEERLADEGEGKLQDVIFPKEDFEQGDVVGAFIDVLKKNFFQNFIVVVFSNSDRNIVKDAKI